MGRKTAILLAILLIAAVLAGCGTKNARQVVNDLSKRSEEMESYISHGKMTLLTGQEPLDYEVEVWYKKPDFYRVVLKNLKKDIVQVLLRNEEGVYVLTPYLKKSFRFQSDWPTAGGQVYLYQTLLSSIVDDQKRQFQAGKNEYQFEVAAHYSLNRNFAKQRILLDRNLHPKKVEVLNQDNDVMVKMEFDRFQENAQFDPDAFDMQRNMDSFSKEAETMAAMKETKTVQEKSADASVTSVMPSYIPEGSRFADEQTINGPGGPIVIQRFKGEKSFTLTERKPQSVEASLPVLGKPVELERTVGVLIEMGDKKRLSWIYDGTEFDLIGKLSPEELVGIANSTFDQPAK
jgi:outer membrane lipoprotein-sorting protein